jgi:acyl-CoA thioester hydrolase
MAMEAKTIFSVRYAETDQMGIAHHSNYSIWFELGRTDFFHQLGISYADLEKKGILLPLYGLSCKFIFPARYDEKIAVMTNLKNITRSRINFSYQLINKIDDKLLATGETMHAWTNQLFRPVDAQKIAPEYFLILKNSI